MVWRLVCAFSSDNLDLPTAGLAETIPGESGHRVVHVPRAHGRMFALIPNRQLATGAVNVVIENNQHTFGQIPSHRSGLVIHVANALVFKLRLAGHGGKRLERALEVAVGVALHSYAR